MRTISVLVVGLVLFSAYALLSSHSFGITAFEFGQLEAGARYEYNRDIRPILADKCFACHGFDASQRQASLRLDQSDGAYAAGDSGKIAIVPGEPEKSELWQRIESNDMDLQMPPKHSHKALTEAEREMIKAWIEQGAEYEGHWAFQRVRHPVTSYNDETGSEVASASIDDWIASPLQEHGFALSPEADRATLLRRLSLDLTGLPPTPEEIEQFLRDESPDCWEKQIDRLLQAPSYGERMAVMWLDVARYGDTSGYLHDILRTGWPWRDWVIKAFQDDMPFDRFVLEQIAGDLLENPQEGQILATSFCRNHLITTEGGTIAAEFLNEYAADRVQTFGTAFLGLSFNCCRCHDHKFDALTQDDFYSLQAYFNSITEKHSENNPAPAYEPYIEATSPLMPNGEKVKVMVMKEAAEPTKTFVLTRGQYDMPDASRPVDRRIPNVFRVDSNRYPPTRLGLAQWVTSEENPLLARVIVNRIWQKFFVRGIVLSLDDFGVQGDYPSHPELLDQLAYEFQHSDRFGAEHAWSIKFLIKKIVSSRTYKQSSKVRAELVGKDPENRLLGYFPRRRLLGEELRDQALFVSGVLSQNIGGAPVFPYQPDGLWEERANEGSNTKVYQRSAPDGLYRKSLYTFWKRTCPPPLMSLFDAPDRTYCTVKRVATNTPLQALALLNEEQFLECAKLLAARTMEERVDDVDRLNRVMTRLTGRDLSPQELAWAQELLSVSRTRFREAPQDAEQLLLQGVSTVSGELSHEDLAAWMVVVNAFMNLDEALVRN
jgi:hypothetical protein